jgi:hypothetical protein
LQKLAKPCKNTFHIHPRSFIQNWMTSC